MRVYMFTYHGYGTWLPNKSKGYVRRNRGVLHTDHEMAGRYRQRMTHDAVVFSPAHQQMLIDTTIEACGFLKIQLLAVGTDPTHVHIIVAWRDERPWLKIRTAIKQAISRKLNLLFDRRPWLAEGASRKRVRDQAHLVYLHNVYLPGKHRGLQWNRKRGVFQLKK